MIILALEQSFGASGMTYAWKSTDGTGAITRGIPADACPATPKNTT